MGVQEPEQLARHILHSKGPSGENKEYLFMLEKSLLELGESSGDKHVENIASRVRKLEAPSDPEVTAASVDNEVRRVRSGQSHGEQEELEASQ